MALKPFTWGANGEALTPAQAKARREAATALMNQSGAPTTFGGGLARVGDVIRGIALDKQAGEAETAHAATRKGIIEGLIANQNAGMPDVLAALSDPTIAADPASAAVVSAIMQQQQQQAGWAREDAQMGQQREWHLADVAAAQEAEQMNFKRDAKHDYSLLDAQANQPMVINDQLVVPATGAVTGDYRDPTAANGAKYMNVGDGTVMNTTTGEFITAPKPEGGSLVDFDDTSGIRKEVFSLPSYKNFSQALPIYNSMAETAGRNTRASDLNLVYGLGKIMDPTSVVREGEMVMVQNTASLPDWLQGAINSLNGGAGISEETRKAIMAEAYGRMKGYQDAFTNDANHFQGIAERYQINPADIIPTLSTFEPWAPPEVPAGGPLAVPAAAPTLPAPTAPQSTVSPAELDSLLQKYGT